VTLFRKPQILKTVSCEDVVAAFGALVEQHPMTNDPALLPFEPAIIKASLVQVAIRRGTQEAVEVAKSGFGMLNFYLTQAKDMDISAHEEAHIHALLDTEHDELEGDFDSRLAFERSRLNA
jgi:hypothetical protein